MLAVELQKENINYVKLTSAAFGGALMTGAAFVFMHYLISQESVRVPEPRPVEMIEIAKPKKDSLVKEIKKLPAPPKITPPPPRALTQVTETPGLTEISTFNIEVPNSKVSMNTNLGMPQHGDATPIVRSEPKYPVIAARDGVEGWVELSFAISPTGEVINIEVVNAEPKRIFNRAAANALRRWKYRPKIVDGKAVMQNNQSVVLEFKLTQ